MCLSVKPIAVYWLCLLSGEQMYWSKHPVCKVLDIKASLTNLQWQAHLVVSLNLWTLSLCAAVLLTNTSLLLLCIITFGYLILKDNSAPRCGLFETQFDRRVDHFWHRDEFWWEVLYRLRCIVSLCASSSLQRTDNDITIIHVVWLKINKSHSDWQVHEHILAFAEASLTALYISTYMIDREYI